MVTIADVIKIKIPSFQDENGTLSVADKGELPFAVVRAFWITAAHGATRGEHAHRRCAQIMFCLHGSCEVQVDDGRNRKNVALEEGNVGLLVPSTIWAEERFGPKSNVLLVLCDRPYKENDYIRDYQQFREFRAGVKSDGEVL